MRPFLALEFYNSKASVMLGLLDLFSENLKIKFYAYSGSLFLL